MTIGHWINGTNYMPAEYRTGPIFDPAIGETVDEVVIADERDVDTAVAAASDAFKRWSRFSLARRQTVLFRFRELLDSRKTELAQIVTREHGKALSDALGEIARGQ